VTKGDEEREKEKKENRGQYFMCQFRLLLLIFRRVFFFDCMCVPFLWELNIRIRSEKEKRVRERERTILCTCVLRLRMKMR